MTNKFNIGDVVITLVDKVRNTKKGPIYCKKGTKGTVCNNSSPNYVILDVINSKNNWDTFDYGINEIQLIEESK